jgi:diaminohydroxyphosphoribosylaminopyrimidine deaminase/5-amino-6-(5-phosphoribosylamino)uracil reductase
MKGDQLLCNDEKLMERAIELAKMGWGRTNPNPLVGAVFVKDGRVIAEGFHRALGKSHAEVDALDNAAEDVSGSTLYVNLEPCSHYGRTPPCAKAIIDANLKKVVVAMLDPNPKVSGRGIKMLRDAGIEVKVGVLENEALKLNEIFINYIVNKKPFVIMKSAVTLDGKIATASGDSKWITGEDARNYVHVIRDRVSAIMVGINTVLKDNPSLTTRRTDKEGRDPIRIIVDSKGILPEDSNVINGDSKAGVILATTSGIDEKKEERLSQRGIKVIKADDTDKRVNLQVLMDELYKLEIDSVLLEGGGTLNSSAISSGIVNKVMYFIAPKIIGGKNAPTSVEGDGADKMNKALMIRDISIRKYGDDILLEGYL